MAKGTITPSAIAVNNIQTLPDLVVGQASNLKLLFDKGDSDQQTYINTVLIPELNGDDGSKKIGHNSVNIVADNVNEAIEEVRQIAVDAQAGTIIDGSITDLKLSNAPTEIKQRVIDLTDDFSNFQADYEYQAPTVVGQQIRVQKLGVSLISKFYLSTPVTGGSITISTDGGATSIALKDGEGNAVTELTAGLKEVVYVAPFFILRSSGGLQEFFGDGSDGTIPDLNVVCSAPNGGTVANLWDMNAGTTFTTGTLSSASDQVVFSIDFGSPVLISKLPDIARNLRFYQASISTGTSRSLELQYSSDGVSYIASASTSITTTPKENDIQGQLLPYRYWRLVLKAGGSSCTLSMQGVTLNYMTGDTQTTKVFRILEPSTLNGAAVVKQYTEYVLPVGYEHTTQNPCQGLIIYSQCNATVNGILDMSQKAGLAPNGNAIPMLITKNYISQGFSYSAIDANVKSLLRFEGNVGSTSFTDETSKTWTSLGTPTVVDKSNFKYDKCAYFDGSSALTTLDNADFTLGASNFTIEFFMNAFSFNPAGSLAITGQNDSGNTDRSFLFYVTGAGAVASIIQDSAGTNKQITGGTNVIGQWVHVALVRNGNTLTLYVNGVSQGTADVTGFTVRDSVSKVGIGQAGDRNFDRFVGLINDYRISNVARYTAAFTPTTVPFYGTLTQTDVEAMKKYFQLTNVLQTLRGGYGGNGGYGGGYSGSTGRQTSVGIGGAGRQNLGGFGGGGSGGSNGSSTPAIGGSILNAEIGGGFVSVKIDNSAACNASAIGVNGSGAIGTLYSATGTISTGKVYGGGSGGTGATSTSTAPSNTSDSQYAGGLAMLIAKGNITINGTIRANGGAGSNGSNGVGVAGGGGGGGGSGSGCIAIFYSGTYSNTGTIQLNGGSGGTGGSGVGTGEAGGSGSSGSANVPHIQQI